MRRLQLVLFLILLAVPGFGQQPTAPVEVRSPDGRIVILKPDGTWEYKKEAPAPAPKTAIPTNPATPETLSPNFSGDEVTTLLHQLVDLRKRLVKSEFETSAAYEARVAEEKKKPIVGSRTAEDSFYLVSSAMTAEYNADTQIMTFTLAVRKNVMAEVMRGSRAIEDRNTATDLSRISLYSVSLGSYDDPKVFFDQTNGLPLSGGRYDQQFSARVNLSVEEAKRLKTGTKAVLVVRFEEPYAIGGYLSGAQFQTRLLDVQFFDQQTGRVLAKLGATVVTNSGPPTPPKKNPHLEKAQELYNARRDDEALAELRQAVIDEPTSADAFLLTGRIHVQRNDQEAAIAALKTALFWDSKLIDAHILLGRIFFARGDLAEARKYAGSALALDPNNAEAQSLQRQILR
jgi:tetratricopeptide (TPR) repeat protein